MGMCLALPCPPDAIAGVDTLPVCVRDDGPLWYGACEGVCVPGCHTSPHKLQKRPHPRRRWPLSRLTLRNSDSIHRGRDMGIARPHHRFAACLAVCLHGVLAVRLLVYWLAGCSSQPVSTLLNSVDSPKYTSSR